MSDGKTPWTDRLGALAIVAFVLAMVALALWMKSRGFDLDDIFGGAA